MTRRSHRRQLMHLKQLPHSRRTWGSRQPERSRQRSFPLHLATSWRLANPLCSRDETGRRYSRGPPLRGEEGRENQRRRPGVPMHGRLRSVRAGAASRDRYRVNSIVATVAGRLLPSAAADRSDCALGVIAFACRPGCRRRVLRRHFARPDPRPRGPRRLSSSPESEWPISA